MYSHENTHKRAPFMHGLTDSKNTQTRQSRTALHAFSQLSQKAKRFTVSNTTRQSSNPRPATHSYLWKILELMVSLVGIDLKGSSGTLSNLPLLISGRSNLVKSHH